MLRVVDVAVDDIKRAYVLNGVYIPRVSAVVGEIYPWVPMPWIPAGAGERAMQAGTEMHASIEGYLRGMYGIDEVRGDGGHFKTYMEQHPDWALVACETKIVSETTMVAGMFDALFHDTTKDEYVLVDWKRSRKLYDSSAGRYTLQTMLYKHILAVAYGINVSQSYIVLLHPDLPMPHEYAVDDSQDDGALSDALAVAARLGRVLNPV